MNSGGGAAASRSAVATSSRCKDESEQAGSVALASPVSANAWQRQPPKSIVLRGQLRHGSAIHSVPRNALNAAPWYQISASGRSLTLSNSSVVMVSAAWQGRTLPEGVTFRFCLAQPPMHGFGYRA